MYPMGPNVLVPLREVSIFVILASFVDLRDDDIPGPGSHNSSRIDKTTPTKWKFGTGT